MGVGALGLKLGKLAFGAGKAIYGAQKNKSAGGASLVDPTQSSIVNMMKRERRAIKTGTSDSVARNSLRQTANLMQKRSILAGGRSNSHIRKLISDTEGQITAGKAQESMGLLGQIVEQTENQAKRSMDLVELRGERQRLQGTADKVVGQKNMYAQAAKIGDMLKGKDDSALGKKVGSIAKGVGDAVKSNNGKLKGSGAIKGAFKEAIKGTGKKVAKEAGKEAAKGAGKKVIGKVAKGILKGLLK